MTQNPPADWMKKYRYIWISIGLIFLVLVVAYYPNIRRVYYFGKIQLLIYLRQPKSRPDQPIDPEVLNSPTFRDTFDTKPDLIVRQMFEKYGNTEKAREMAVQEIKKFPNVSDCSVSSRGDISITFKSGPSVRITLGRPDPNGTRGFDE